VSIVQMSISAGLLIVAVTVIRSVALNRLPKTMFLVLWGVILARLLVPVSIPVSVPMRIGAFSAVNEAVMGVSQNVSHGGGLLSESAGMPPAVTHVEETVMGTTPLFTPAVTGRGINVIGLVWLAGMLIALAYFAVVLFGSYRKLRYALPVNGDGFLDEWLARHRLLRPIAIMQSDRVTTPLAVGVTRPRIILPKTIDMNDRQLLNHVLTHEYLHIKRGDAILKIFLVLALCIHWFNPLVWVMFVLANRDLELTCDEMVVRRFGLEAKEAYAYSIIDMAEHRSRFVPFFSGFAKNAAEERIESIMKTKKISIPSKALALTLVAVLTVGGFAAVNAAAGDNTGEVAVVSLPIQVVQPLSVPRAREIALSITSGGAVTGLELVPNADIGLVYNIVIVSDTAIYNVSMNARTGDIFRFTAGQTRDITPADVGVVNLHQPYANHRQDHARLDEAAAVALARAGGGMVGHICIDRERGVPVYHVRIYVNENRVDYYLHRETLAVVMERTRRHNNASPLSASFMRRRMDATPALSFNQAADIALLHKGGGRVRDVSRGYLRGVPVFDVDITTVNGEKWCFYIDIHSGVILWYHRDD